MPLASKARRQRHHPRGHLGDRGEHEPTPGSVGALGALEATLSWEREVVASVDLTGFVVVEDCPVAVAMIAEEGPVVPGTVLHLSGVDSYSPVAQVSTYTWSVDTTGSVGRFAPDVESRRPPWRDGRRQIPRLSVSDSTGKAACILLSDDPGRARGALYIELPGRPRRPRSKRPGPLGRDDLDLHLAHPEASGATWTKMAAQSLGLILTIATGLIRRRTGAPFTPQL